MKRAFLLLLPALMLLTLPALSLARDYPAYAVVSNSNPEDRLNLREAPSAGSASLGKYFNGVFAYARTMPLPRAGYTCASAMRPARLTAT